MPKLGAFSLIGVFLLCKDVVQASSPCDDWIPFGNEYCYKIVHKLETFEDAAKSCQQIGGSMLKIEKTEEQAFLVEFLFNQSKIVDTVWLGGKFEAGKYLWNDKTPLKMTNWAPGSPKNRAAYCIEMKADLDTAGKWDDVPCGKSNLAVCQKRPTLSFAKMEEILLALQEELKETKAHLAATQESLSETRHNLTGTQVELTRQITAMKQSPIVPIGFTYVQLPKDKSPKVVWPGLSWTEVSSEYRGVFFRVEGDGSAPFGAIQEENGPFIEQVITGDALSSPTGQQYTYDVNITLPKSGWSKGIRLGDYPGTTDIYLNIKRPDIAELRPKNMAVRVWRRTA